MTKISSKALLLKVLEIFLSDLGEKLNFPNNSFTGIYGDVDNLLITFCERVVKHTFEIIILKIPRYSTK